MPSAALSIPEDATYDSISHQHRVFVDKFLETGNALLAAEHAGYKDGRAPKDPNKKSTNASLKQKASKLRRELACVIDERLPYYARSADMAILGLNVLKELAQNADSETVRMNSAKEIVNRCVEPLTQKKEVTHNVRHGALKDEDLDKRIEALRQQLNGNVIDVTPEEAGAD